MQGLEDVASLADGDVLQLPGQLIGHLGSPHLAHLFGQTLDGQVETALYPRGAQPEQERTHLVEPAPQLLDGQLHLARGRRSVPPGQQLLRHLQAQPRGREGLGRPVVKLPGKGTRLALRNLKGNGKGLLVMHRPLLRREFLGQADQVHHHAKTVPHALAPGHEALETALLPQKVVLLRREDAVALLQGGMELHRLGRPFVSLLLLFDDPLLRPAQQLLPKLFVLPEGPVDLSRQVSQVLRQLPETLSGLLQTFGLLAADRVELVKALLDEMSDAILKVPYFVRHKTHSPREPYRPPRERPRDSPREPPHRRVRPEGSGGNRTPSNGGTSDKKIRPRPGR